MINAPTPAAPAPQPAAVQPGPDEELIKKLRDMLDQGVAHHRPLVANTELTMAFLSGNQYVKYSMSKGIAPIENKANERRVTDNQMLPAYRWRREQFFKQLPVITAFEGGNDVIDIERALAASKLCDYWRSNSNWLDAEKEASCWVDVCGMAWIVPVWRSNPFQVENIVKYKFVEKPEESPEGIINFVKRTEQPMPVADLTFDVYHVLKTFMFPLNAKKWTDVFSVITADVVNYDWLENNLEPGELPPKHELRAISFEELNLSALERINNYVSAEFNLMNTVNPLEDQYLLLQYRKRPTRKEPGGRYVAMVGDKVVRSSALPYVEEARAIDPQDKFNLTLGMIPWTSMDIAGRLVPPAPLELMRETQIEYNELLTDEFQNRKTVGRNKLIAERGMIDEDQYDNSHGELILVNPGTSVQPKMIQGQPLTGIDREIARKKEGLDDISGRYAYSRGENPTQVRAGFHLDVLKEESSAIMNGDIRRREIVHERTAKFALSLAQRRMPKSRVIEICGEDIAGSALAFMSGNILTDIRVKEGSAIPRNHAMREAKLAEFLQAGAFIDQKSDKNNMDLFWRMTELGTLNKGVDYEEKHHMRARNENYVMLMGQPVIPINFEDHNIHLEEVMDFMCRPQFYNAPVEIQIIFMAHMEAHSDMLLAQQAPEAFINDQPPGLVEDAAKMVSAPPQLQLAQ